MKRQFDRKVFTPKVFFNDIFFLLINIPKISRAFRNKKVTRAFMEKVMTVSTAVNGCVYCAWFHANQAVKSGISQEEIKNMLNLQFQADASEFEVPALLYTQHYAETSQNPDAEMTQRYKDFYGTKNSEDIFMFIRIIYSGNLTGNTWDSVLSRFKGNPAPKSKLWFELVFFLIFFLFMFPVMAWKKIDEKKKARKSIAFTSLKDRSV